MKQFNENEFNQDWSIFWNSLTKAGLDAYYDEEKLQAKMKDAAGALNEDTGLAYPGGLLHHIVLFTAIAQRLAKMVSNTFDIEEESLLKVCCLMHLSKMDMYIPNDNDWEIKNRGLNYKFSGLNGRLKFGERSILQAMNQGVKLEPEEFEAIRCLDKKDESTKTTELFDSILSTIVRQANELAYAIEKEKNK